jgi:hypothetical protein
MASALDLSGDELVADNQLSIAALRISDAQSGDQDLAVSTALGLLRDKDDNIQLDVPIQGRLHELSVDVSNIVQLAVRNAATQAAFTYAKFALQPFGGLLLAKDLAKGLATPRFAPIPFPEGQAELVGESIAYVEKLAALMIKRPNLSLTICGFAQSLEVSPEELSPGELALRRSEVVGARLAELQVSGPRVISCKPVVEDEISGQEAQVPRVEILL